MTDTQIKKLTFVNIFKKFSTVGIKSPLKSLPQFFYVF
jgi:hypothetical protein